MRRARTAGSWMRQASCNTIRIDVPGILDAVCNARGKLRLSPTPPGLTGGYSVQNWRKKLQKLVVMVFEFTFPDRLFDSDEQNT